MIFFAPGIGRFERRLPKSTGWFDFFVRFQTDANTESMERLFRASIKLLKQGDFGGRSSHNKHIIKMTLRGVAVESGDYPLSPDHLPALIDAFRAGRLRERNIAIEKIRAIVQGESHHDFSYY